MKHDENTQVLGSSLVKQPSFEDLKALALDKTGGNGQEKLQEARAICSQLVAGDPANPDFLFVHGLIDFQLGLAQEASSWMEKAIVFAPESLDIAYNYALMLLAQKKNAMALPLMRRVVARNPGHAKAHYHVGNLLKEAGDLPGALVALTHSLELNPRSVEVLNNRGNILKEMGRVPEAIQCYEAALEIKPDYHLVLNNLGVALFLQNDLDGAEALHQKALAVMPDYPEAYSNIGMIHRLRGDIEGALFYCQKALALRPAYPEALNNFGNALKDAGRFEESIAVYSESLTLRPDDADVHNNMAMAYLALGRFADGWREQEWRWKSTQMRAAHRLFRQPQWSGEAGEGRSLLVRAEQGFGDTLQFCRYAPLIRARGFQVIMEVQPALKRLIVSLDGVSSVVSKGDKMPDFDFHCPMMSLPFVFGTDLDTIPREVPYLKAERADIKKWRERIKATGDTRMKVGLVWAGSARTHSPDLIAADRKRSMTPELLEPLMKIKEVCFFSLQKDGAKAPDSFQLVDWMQDSADFADTAALIMNLDLVISVDTAVAHLAGALGKPVWILNRFNSCWRWMAGRDDSPWYPKVLRLFRQKKMDDWGDVVARVCEALEIEANRKLKRVKK